MNKLFAQLVEKRHLTDDFLHPRYENLTDPFILPDMDKAVARLKEAKEMENKSEHENRYKGKYLLLYGRTVSMSHSEVNKNEMRIVTELARDIKSLRQIDQELQEISITQGGECVIHFTKKGE